MSKGLSLGYCLAAILNVIMVMNVIINAVDKQAMRFQGNARRYRRPQDLAEAAPNVNEL